MTCTSSLGLLHSARTFSLSSILPSSATQSNQGAAASDLVSPDVKASEAASQSANVGVVPSADVADAPSAVSAAFEGAETHMADATEKVQTLAELGQLSGWPNVRLAQTLLDWTVEATGLPWWATIALVTVTVRVAVLPLVFKGQANAIRLANINPTMQQHMKDLQYAKSTGNSMLMAESASAVQKLMRDNNCSPFKSLITPAVLMPVFASFFFALRGLANAGLPSMTTGGLSWFTNLTVADPTYILPVVSAAMTLAVIETGAEIGAANVQNTQQAKFMRWFLRILTVVSVPFLAGFPAAVFCYWATNNTFSLLQLVVLQTPAVRKALRLPERINHAEEDMPKGKPMGFWDSVSAGKSSQTAHSQVKRDSVPSVLQTQRQLEEGREAALKRILESQPQEESQQTQASPILSEVEKLKAGKVEAQSQDQAQKVAPLQPQVIQPSGSKNDRKQKREEERRNRVQASRERRVKQRS